VFRFVLVLSRVATATAVDARGRPTLVEDDTRYASIAYVFGCRCVLLFIRVANATAVNARGHPSLVEDDTRYVSIVLALFLHFKHVAGRR
jgi:hypothetical protein